MKTARMKFVLQAGLQRTLLYRSKAMPKAFIRISGVRVQEKAASHHERVTTVGALFMIGKVTRVVCECSCGTVFCTTMCNLLQHKTTSCGCFAFEQQKTMLVTHGATVGKKVKSEYGIWHNLIRRTTDATNNAYHNYGGRGIVACQGIASSYESFIAIVGDRPTAGHSIDREENNGHYSCGQCDECKAKEWQLNVRWATKLIQANNTRANRRLTFYGKTKSLADWSRISQISPRVIWNRLASGWTDKAAVWTPIRK